MRSNSLEQFLDDNDETNYLSPHLEKYQYIPYYLNRDYPNDLVPSQITSNSTSYNFQPDLHKMIITHEINDHIIDNQIIPYLFNKDNTDIISKIRILDDLIQLGREDSILREGKEYMGELMMQTVAKLLEVNDTENLIVFVHSLFQLYFDDLIKLENVMIKVFIQFKDNEQTISSNHSMNLMMYENIWFIQRQAFLSDQIQDGLNVREIKNYFNILNQYVTQYKEINQNQQYVQPQFKLGAAVSRLKIKRRIGLFVENIPIQIYSEHGPFIPIRSWHTNTDGTLRGSIKKHIKMVHLTFPKQYLINWDQFKVLNNEERKIYLYGIVNNASEGVQGDTNNNEQLNGLKRVLNLNESVENALKQYIKDNTKARVWDEKKKNQTDTRQDLFNNQEQKDMLVKEFSEIKSNIVIESLNRDQDMWRI